LTKILGEDENNCKRTLSSPTGDNILWQDDDGSVKWVDGSADSPFSLANLQTQEAGQVQFLAAFTADGCMRRWRPDPALTSEVIPIRSGNNIVWKSFGEILEEILPSGNGVLVRDCTTNELVFVSGNINQFFFKNNVGVFQFGNVPGVTILPGQVIQSVYASYTANTSTTSYLSSLPPINTEGVQVMTSAITPTSASSLIRATFHFKGSISLNKARIAAALFRNADAAAIACATSSFQISTTGEKIGWIRHYDAPAATTSTTYAIRMGGPIGEAAGATAYINADTSGNTRYGTLNNLALILEEIQT
jgi:hypothetical protein